MVTITDDCATCRSGRVNNYASLTMVHPTEACAEHSGRFFVAWLSYPMIVQKCVPGEQTLARDRQHHWRTAFAGKRWRPRYPLPSQHLCRARLRFSRQCRSNIDNHIPQMNPWILEPCLENLARTLPSDEPLLFARFNAAREAHFLPPTSTFRSLLRRGPGVQRPSATC
ncbi:hypothetical protein CA85_09170 [Allorhodopirellula solitaria]|uniref:Uncharacterized protein n=1 Tax=Allorhodopirellula solitaria TaxID=2527987 RepID=A0A5C5YGI8_9BACT|nr:hypothetical protein CA85_09170 [Allorhodopirellula solitaria]